MTTAVAEAVLPNDVDEDREAFVASLSHDVAQYIARFDCHNIDTTVNPIDLLREVCKLITSYDDKLEELDKQIEKLEAGYSDEIVKLQGEVSDLKKQLGKLDKLPWLKDLIAAIP